MAGAWVEQIFEAQAANGGVVRRSIQDVYSYASLDEVISEARERRFHVIETGGQIVVLCHEGAITIHV